MRLVYQFQGEKVRVTRPINADTRRAPCLRMARPTNFKLGVWMEDDDPHQPQAPYLQGQRSQGHMISLSRVGPMAHKSKTNICSITKIGRRVPHDTCYTAHQFQGQKFRVPGWLTQTHKMYNIFRTIRPKNFKVGVWMADVDSHHRQAPWPPRLKAKVISSNCLYVSSLPLLNSGKKMLYLCH